MFGWSQASCGWRWYWERPLGAETTAPAAAAAPRGAAPGRGRAAASRSGSPTILVAAFGAALQAGIAVKLHGHVAKARLRWRGGAVCADWPWHEHHVPTEPRWLVGRLESDYRLASEGLQREAPQPRARRRRGAGAGSVQGSAAPRRRIARRGAGAGCNRRDRFGKGRGLCLGQGRV